MANITNQVVIQFSNDYLRPIAEAVRNVQIRLNDAKVKYTTNIAGLLAGQADGDTLADGAPDDGRPQVTKKDLADLIAQLGGIITELDATGAEALRAKFTVRPPQIG